MQPVSEITRNDLYEWELTFAAEGTLPQEAQRRLLEKALGHPPRVPYQRPADRYEMGYTEGYECGFADGEAQAKYGAAP